MVSFLDIATSLYVYYTYGGLCREKPLRPTGALASTAQAARRLPHRRDAFFGDARVFYDTETPARRRRGGHHPGHVGRRRVTPCARVRGTVRQPDRQSAAGSPRLPIARRAGDRRGPCLSSAECRSRRRARW